MTDDERLVPPATAIVRHAVRSARLSGEATPSQPPRQPGSILFVCGMNAIRSPMAEAIAHSILPNVYVASAGVRGGERDPFVDVILAENGLKLGEFTPRSLEELGDGFFDLIVTMSPEAHHVALDRTGADAVAVEFWPMPDPSVVTGSRQQIIDAYRDVYRRIEERLQQLRPPGESTPG